MDFLPLKSFEAGRLGHDMVFSRRHAVKDEVALFIAFGSALSPC